VAREGVAAATTRRIAEEAQLPSGIVHYWFANKDELLEELASRVMGEFNAKLSLPIEQGTDPLVSLLTRLREVFSVVETDDHGRQLSTYELTAFCLRSPSLSGVARQQYDNYRAAAKSAIESWLEAHPVKLPADTSTLAAFFAAMFDGLALAWLVDPEAARPDEVFQLVAALMVGYTPPA
jgi:AcrR family transcriptional regulator